MSEYSFYQALLYSYIGLAAITALYLLKITAPYGRHARSGFGPKLNATFGWVLMEAPASLAPLLLLLLGGRHNPVLFCLFKLAILNCIFPNLLRRLAYRSPVYYRLDHVYYRHVYQSTK